MKILFTSDIHFGYDGKTPAKWNRHLSKINSDAYDIVVIAGDISSHKQSQYEKCIKFLRNIIKKQIFVCYGNHDFWRFDREYSLTLEEIFSTKQEINKKYDIVYLPSIDKIVFDGVEFMGFDGWYKSMDPPTKDKNRLGASPELDFAALSSRVTKDVNRIINQKKTEEKRIVVTHFGFNTNLLKEDLHCADENVYNALANSGTDILLTGHLHKFMDLTTKEKVHMLSAGSNYNIPKSIIFEV